MGECVYLSLGSNIGDRLHYLRRALQQLDHHPDIRLQQLSSVYETNPVGFIEQADFLNMVASIRTTLDPGELLQVTQGIEQSLHRQRTVKWGPRTLDIDILLYGQSIIMTERLIVPHPRMMERAFVLIPLMEVAPGLVLPGTRQTVAECLEHVTGKEGVKLCPTISLAAEFGLTVS